jgi:hypothetical protein
MLFEKSTRFAAFTPRAALLVIAIVLAMIIYGAVVYHPAPPGTEQKKVAGEDLRCYRRIVERIRDGGGYYNAAREELHSSGYHTGSVFNWRLPLLAWLLARLPSTDSGRVLLILVASLTVVLWTRVLGQDHYSFARLTFGSIALLGPLLYAVLPELFLHHDLWAGTLISLSLAAYAKGWKGLSVTSGLLALFLRELTLPFICAMLILAVLEGRRRQALAWSIGIIAFFAILLLHWSMIKAALPVGQPVGLLGSWIAFGGWPFVLDTAHMHPYLFLAPPWVTAIVLPLTLLGLLGWRGRLGSRVASTVWVYLVVFLFVGLPYNRYWGLLYGGVLPLGLLYTGHSIVDLGRSARLIR